METEFPGETPGSGMSPGLVESVTTSDADVGYDVAVVNVELPPQLTANRAPQTTASGARTRSTRKEPNIQYLRGC
jgi:hypothetical protein